MGDEPRERCLSDLIIFLDENHCRNPHIVQAIDKYGASCQKHLDHFVPGTPDTVWLPVVGRNGWCLLTTDARIRRNLVEKEAVRNSLVRMFYFSRNQLSGSEMGEAITRALPRMENLVRNHAPPFTASVSRTGEVTLRDTFESI
ncbi:MAG: hypothetical protein M3O02_11075 [Acidobacteriota bacterium]|nr:hypothetical protein [Acidobacteriota bacterium]